MKSYHRENPNLNNLVGQRHMCTSKVCITMCVFWYFAIPSFS